MRDNNQNILIAFLKKIASNHLLSVIFTITAIVLAIVSFLLAIYDAHTDENEKIQELKNSIKQNALIIKTTFDPSIYHTVEADSVALLKAKFEDSVIKLVQAWEDVSLESETVYPDSHNLDEKSRAKMLNYVNSTKAINELNFESISCALLLQEKLPELMIESSELYSINNLLVEYLDEQKKLLDILNNYYLNRNDNKSNLDEIFMQMKELENSPSRLRYYKSMFQLFIDIRRS